MSAEDVGSVTLSAPDDLQLEKMKGSGGVKWILTKARFSHDFCLNVKNAERPQMLSSGFTWH